MNNNQPTQSEKTKYMLRFTSWAKNQRVNTFEDCRSIRTVCKYLQIPAWQKCIIDDYLEGRISEKGIDS
jgi:hypothetical protein